MGMLLRQYHGDQAKAAPKPDAKPDGDKPKPGKAKAAPKK